MFCIKCGHQINGDASFCPACGTSQETNTSNLPEVIDEYDNNGFNFHRWIIENSLESCESLLRAQDFDTLDVLHKKEDCDSRH